VNTQHTGYNRLALQHELDASEVEKIMNAESRMIDVRICLLEAEVEIDELCEWIAVNGHGAVSRQKKNYNSLERWKRQFYKKIPQRR
jgi:hypothetical protein